MPTSNAEKQPIEVNGRRYRWPTRPLVVVCIDGSEPDYAESDGGGYIERAIAAGAMPFMERMLASGTSRVAESAMPSFTMPSTRPWRPALSNCQTHDGRTRYPMRLVISSIGSGCRS